MLDVGALSEGLTPSGRSGCASELDEEALLGMECETASAFGCGAGTLRAFGAHRTAMWREVNDFAGLCGRLDALRSACGARVQVDLEVRLGEAPAVVKGERFAPHGGAFAPAGFDGLVTQVSPVDVELRDRATLRE